jgi:hypothetical protein
LFSSPGSGKVAHQKNREIAAMRQLIKQTIPACPAFLPSALRYAKGMKIA